MSPPTDHRHDEFMTALESRSYRRLFVRRSGATCHLVIHLVDQPPHVFVDRFGRQMSYRHAWQVRDWLESRFGIPPEDVPVE